MQGGSIRSVGGAGVLFESHGAQRYPQSAQTSSGIGHPVVSGCRSFIVSVSAWFWPDKYRADRGKMVRRGFMVVGLENRFIKQPLVMFKSACDFPSSVFFRHTNHVPPVFMVWRPAIPTFCFVHDVMSAGWPVVRFRSLFMPTAPLPKG